MLRIFNKKGVSPIIATVLLVVITIAIGATTMAFIKSLTDTNLDSAKSQVTKMACGTDVKAEITIVNNREQICYNTSNGGLSMLLHNIGSKDIKGFLMTAILYDGTPQSSEYIDSSTDVILKDSYKRIYLVPSPIVDYNSTNVTKWIVEPKIQSESGKDLIVCSDADLVRESTQLLACS